jgi:hypothetical protein
MNALDLFSRNAKSMGLGFLVLGAALTTNLSQSFAQNAPRDVDKKQQKAQSEISQLRCQPGQALHMQDGGLALWNDAYGNMGVKTIQDTKHFEYSYFVRDEEEAEEFLADHSAVARKYAIRGARIKTVIADEQLWDEFKGELKDQNKNVESALKSFERQNPGSKPKKKKRGPMKIRDPFGGGMPH